MHRLSDDELLRVFAALDVASLVGPVSGVCRRWRRLSAYRDAWRHRDFSCEVLLDGEVHPAIVTRVLEVAPCLRSLDIGCCEYDQEGLDELVCGTPCAAEELRLELNWHPVFAPEQALRNQASNGRLRRLSVKLFCLSGKEEPCREFFRAVGALRLEELAIDEDEDASDEEDFDPVPADCEEWRAGSLKRLRYCRKASDTFLAFLLKARAASLETVNLDQSHHRPGISLPSLKLLAGCINLRQVAIPAVVEMESLLSCPLLESLSLDVSLRGVNRIQLTRLDKSIILFFRTGVTRLKQLKFINKRSSKKSSSLQCIAVAFGCYHDGVPVLEDLSIGYLHGVRASDVLSKVLPEESEDATDTSLNVSPLDFLVLTLSDNAPRLRTLEVHNKPSLQLLLGLSGFPALEVFTVTGAQDSACMALSTDLERKTLSVVMRRMPRLHFKVTCREGCPCASLSYGSLLPAALRVFGHPPHEECRLHDQDLEWVHVDSL